MRLKFPCLGFLILLLIASFFPNLAFAAISAHDFEEASFVLDGWGGNTTAGTGTIALAVDQVHHLTQSSKTTMAANNDLGYCYVNFGDNNLVYIRAYFRIDNRPINAWTRFGLINIRDVNNNRDMFAIEIYQKAAGTYVWRILYRAAGAFTAVEDSNAVIANDTWTCLEVKIDCSTNDGDLDGSYEFWVDGVSVWSITAKDTDSTSIDLLRIGVPYENTDNAANNIWLDCVQIDTAYIGIESTATSLTFNSSIAITFIVAKLNVLTWRVGSSAPFSFAVASLYQGTSTYLLNLFGSMLFQFALNSQRVIQFSRQGTAPIGFSVDMARAVSWALGSSVPLSFMVSTVYSQLVQGFLYFFGSIPLAFTESMERAMSFNLQGTVPLTFIMNGAYARAATILNMFGTVAFNFAINMARTFSFNIFSAETLTFTVNTLSTIIGLPVLLNLFGIIPLVFTIVNTAPFSFPTAADTALALGAVAFVLAVTAIAFTMIRKRRED